MMELDYFLRYANITMLCILGLAALPKAKRNLSMQILALLCLSLVAMLIALSPPYYNFPRTLVVTAAFVNIPNTVLLWMFFESLLEDNYRVTPWHWAIITPFCLLSIILRIGHLGFTNWDVDTISLIVNIISLTLFFHLIFTAAKGWKADLISARRNFRAFFLIGIPLIGVLAVLSEFVYTGTSLSSLPFAKSAIMFPAIVAACIWMLHINPEHFAAQKATDSADQLVLTPRETELYNRLDDLIVEDKVYLQPNLTVSDLAKALAVSDYKIRTLINKKLGFRNFNAFINQYRVEDIKVALEDPEQAHLPILTIALNNGFSSLPPFNRAFKETVGINPRAFRQAKL